MIKKAGQANDKRPGVLLQIKYLSSIYTRYQGQGKCTLLIRSWTSNNAVLPTSAKAKIKILDKNDKEYDYKSLETSKSDSTSAKFSKEMNIGALNCFTTLDSMTTIEFTIY